MSVSDEIQALKEQGRQVKVALGVCNHVRGLYTLISDIEIAVEQYKTEGKFDLIPTETKQGLNRLYQTILQLKLAMEEDVAFADLIE